MSVPTDTTPRTDAGARRSTGPRLPDIPGPLETLGSAWRRLRKMRTADALAFLLTAAGVVTLNAVAAVAVGCGVYVAHWLYTRAAAGAGLRTAPVEAVE